jgi:hypothetical protein
LGNRFGEGAVVLGLVFGGGLEGAEDLESGLLVEGEGLEGLAVGGLLGVSGDVSAGLAVHPGPALRRA